MAFRGPFPPPVGFSCWCTHLGAGFPFASHSIRMLSRGSTMWSFTDCLVMVGGWDTATRQTAGSQAEEPAGSLARRTAGSKSFRNHTEKQASRVGRERGEGMQATHPLRRIPL